MKTQLLACVAAPFLALCASLHAAPINGSFERVPLTGNNTDPVDWRMYDGDTFLGQTFDGVARIAFDSDGSLNNGFSVCSGTLLAGGRYVLTAAHCADNFNVMTVQFGVYDNRAKVTRGVSAAHVHEQWTGALGYGTDIALLELDAPVTSIQGFNLSTTNDVGKDFLIMGYGSTSVGSDFETPSGWDDWGWAHWGTNTADITNNQWDSGLSGRPITNPYLEYLADFDGPEGYFNGLQVVADIFARGAWSSGTGTGFTEALIAGGDSGGGDFVWNGSEWLLSGIHSYGIDVYGCEDLDADGECNSSAWGDISGSTAVYSHLAWIQAVPEPGSLALVMGSLFAAGALRRRRKG